MPLVLHDVSDGVLTLTLNRPDRFNAFHVDLIRELLQRFVEQAARKDVHGVVLTGAGKAFCAGGDVTAMREALQGDPRALFRELTEHLHPLIVGIRNLPKPVVAALNGAVAGGGYGLALACDQRVASTTCSLTPAYRRLGIVPDGGLTALLPRYVGFGAAQRIILNDERLDAETALRLGLVDRVVDPGALLTAAVALSARLADYPPESFARTKELVNRSALDGYEAQMDREREANAESAAGPWLSEGIQSFFDKRPPRFRDMARRG